MIRLVSGFLGFGLKKIVRLGACLGAEGGLFLSAASGATTASFFLPCLPSWIALFKPRWQSGC